MATTVPPLNETQAVILGLLQIDSMHGHRLTQEAEKMRPFFAITRSQVYRELPTLAERGYIRDGKTGPRNSQTYHITASGKKAFGRWLNEHPGRGSLRSPVAVRAYFMWLHTDQQLEQLMANAIEMHTKELEIVRELLAKAEADEDQSAIMALTWAAAYNEATIHWLRENM